MNGLLGVQSSATTGGTRYFERTPDGQLISEDAPSSEQYYATDYLGIGARPRRDEPGPSTAPTPTTPTATSLTPSLRPLWPTRWRFAGGYFAPAIGLYHFGARWYDPTVGRWTQPDSIVTLNDPMNGNLYAYVKDNPINEVDPSGSESLSLNPTAEELASIGIGLATTIIGVLGAASIVAKAPATALVIGGTTLSVVFATASALQCTTTINFSSFFGSLLVSSRLM